MKIDAMSSAGISAAYGAAQSGAAPGFSDALAEATQKAKTAKEEQKLKAACKDFEAMFLNLMYSKMRETVPDNTLYGTSHGEKLMQSMLDTEMTKKMADAGGVGLAAMMYKQLSMQYHNGKQ